MTTLVRTKFNTDPDEPPKGLVPSIRPEPPQVT